MKEYDAIVIGAGMGGLAAALLLSHAGKKTVLLEKNAISGGRLSSYQKDGFTLDIGVHTISRGAKGPVATCLERVGIKDAIEFTNVRPLVCFEGEYFKFPHDLKDKVAPESFEALMTFMADVKAATSEVWDKLDEDKVTLKEYLSRYTDDPYIHACLSRIGSVYCAVPSWILSAGEFVRCMNWEAASRSSGYPMGGCIAITNVYQDAIKEFGGEIINSAPVDTIIIEDGKATGVIAKGEEYRAPLIVSNADIKNTILNLVGVGNIDPEYYTYVEGLEYSWAGFVIRIAVDESITDIKMLSQFGEIPQEGYYEKMRKGVMPTHMNLFLVVPSNFDDSIAPEGKQLIGIASPIPLDLSDEVYDMCADAMIDTAAGFIPGLRDHIMWVDVMNVHAADGMVGEDGSCIGIAQSAGQTGSMRPKIKTPIEGLYIVGGEAGGQGVGIENATSSAVEFFDTYVA